MKTTPLTLLLSLPVAAGFGFASLLAQAAAAPTPPEVPYPDGYRTWRFVSSVVLPPKPTAARLSSDEGTGAAPPGLIHNIYANEKALDGYRTGHCPAGSVLIADWLVLEPMGAELIQGPRKSMSVMVRDPRYTATGGRGFEDFD